MFLQNLFSKLKVLPKLRNSLTVVLIIQTYRPWTPRQTSGWIVNKKIWRESKVYRNFRKRFDWSLVITRHIVMAGPIVETIWLVNGFLRHIAPIAVIAPSSVQNLMNSSSRRLDGKSRSLDVRDYLTAHQKLYGGQIR